MIIPALASYYEQLLKERPDEIARPGWEPCRIDYLLVLSKGGSLLQIVPVGEGKGVRRVVPSREKKTSGVKANFLCDTSSYLLGADLKGNPGRSAKCFEAAAVRHHELLDGVDSSVARAILAYFDAGVPDAEALQEDQRVCYQEACSGRNLGFALLDEEGCLVNAEEDEYIIRAWDCRDEGSSKNDEKALICLATGAKARPVRLHPAIKGVYGAQSSGASLVSFNSSSFESYGHDGEQGRNAPVGESTAQAYGAALNYLLSNRSHNLRIGDTTVVFWSERADQGNADLFSLLLGGMPFDKQRSGSANEEDLYAALSALRVGKLPDLEGIDFDSPFYVLGLAPNNARLAVRFFLMDDFGMMLRNVEAHYRRIQVTHAASDKEVLTPYWLLRAVENGESKNPVVTSELAAPLLRAILTNARYPEALYSNCLLRVKANRDVTYAQAAIIKSCLIRNCNRSEDQVTEELNEKCNDVAYSLGRAFALLGQIQQAANGKDTLTGRYLDAACSRPAVAFPSLLRLSSAHLTKIAKDKPAWAISLERSLSESLSQEKVAAFPKHLSLPEQGDFMLGYYHQKANRYKKKSESDVNENTNNEEA